ncbi:hypothetical protein JXM67_14885 [candidate division WOR-3 bacterium]|nr:hypothetical protein [candidate division WOR-3 bacterium]
MPWSCFTNSIRPRIWNQTAHHKLELAAQIFKLQGENFLPEIAELTQDPYSVVRIKAMKILRKYEKRRDPNRSGKMI